MLHDHWRGKYNSTYQVKVYRIVIYALFYGKISFFWGGGGRGRRVLLVRIDLSKYDQGIIFFQNSRKPKFWSGATEPDVIRTIFFLINR